MGSKLDHIFKIWLIQIDEIKPSIEVVSKLADALGVTLDYLVGKGPSASLDKKNVQRLQAIEQLPEDEKKTVFALLDAFIRDFRAKQQYAVCNRTGSRTGSCSGACSVD